MKNETSFMPDKENKVYRTDKLHTLPVAMDADKMHSFLADLAKQYLQPNLETRSLEIEVLRRRNQRCVIRYRLRVYSPVDKKTIHWNVIGKLYKRNRGERVFADMKKLWRNGFSSDTADHISMPEPLQFSSSLCMLLQAEVPGDAAKVLLRTHPDPHLMQQLARAMAKLHRCQIRLDQPLGVEGHLLRCHPRYPFLAMAFPELASDIDQVVSTARALEIEPGAKTLTPIHGDYHLGQLHLLNGHSWLIDFDALGQGDPAADVGNVLVFLKDKAKKNPGMHVLIDAFLDEYASIMGDQAMQNIPLYEGLTHLRRACKLLRFQERGWRRRVNRMIAKAKNCMEQMEKIH